MSAGGENDAIDEEWIVALVAGAAATALVTLLLVEWPMLVGSAVRGHPALMRPVVAIVGGVRWVFFSGHPDPRACTWWLAYRHALPAPAVWVTLDVLLIAGLAVAGALAWARVDRWRGRRDVATPGWHPRSKVTARAWARPRDVLHLQPADRSTSPGRRTLAAATRLSRRESQPAARPDSWSLGELRGARLRSLPESHLMTVAPTRAGKTTRVLIPALLENDGPAIVLSNKTDVLRATVEQRRRVGPVWVYAPMTPGEVLGADACTWTPLDGCEDWDFALRMGLWLLDADPSSSASEESSGARFYNREAYAVILPPLMHAAALSGCTMADVQGWLRSNVQTLDTPRLLLERAGAKPAADRIAGLQELDERPRSLVLMSAAQLVDVYRFPSVQASDRCGFKPASLTDGGTLYLIAPEAEQEMLAPLFGGIIGQTLRLWERRAAAGTPQATLRILADEAAHLAPLTKLPRYLAVSADWDVRWCLVYQSLAQLRDRYGPAADTIIGNVLSKLFMGPIQDESTRRYLMELLDEETVTSQSWSTRHGAKDGPRTMHERQASKVSAQRLMQLPEGRAVMVHGRDLPAITTLRPYWEMG